MFQGSFEFSKLQYFKLLCVLPLSETCSENKSDIRDKKFFYKLFNIFAKRFILDI